MSKSEDIEYKQETQQEEPPPSTPTPIQEKIELRSNEVRDIIGTPPKWILRWGTTLVILLVLLMAFLAHFIKYPDTISGKITIITSGLPIDVVTNNNGIVSDIFVEDERVVAKGDALVMLQNDVNYVNYMMLEPQVKLMESMSMSSDNLADDFYPKQNLELGDLEKPYKRLCAHFERYRESVSSKSSLVRIGTIEDQKRSINHSLEVLAKDKTAVAQQINVAIKNQSGFTTVKEKQLKLNEIERDIQNFENDLKKIQIEIKIIKENKNLGDQKMWADFQSQLAIMRNKLTDWQDRYLITAPTDGTILMYSPNWEQKLEQPVDKGEILMAIVPFAKEKDKNVSHKPNVELQVKTEGYGKIVKGQQVNIKLDRYPHRDFGLLKAEVTKKSDLQRDESYIVVVELTKGFKTTYGFQLTPAPKMLGTADVLTENRSILGRVFERFQSIKKSNR